MRIAEVSTLNYSVPPQGYGGVERVAYYLTEELVGLGQDVTLFAAAGSTSSAPLVEYGPAIWPLSFPEQMAASAAGLETIAERLADFDIVHFHHGREHLPFAARLGKPNLSTMHVPIQRETVRKINAAYPDVARIALASHQRAAAPELNWAATIPLGIPEHLYKPRLEPGNYFAFISRICEDKGAAEAIEIARRAKIRLAMAGNVFDKDRDYFNRFVKPHIDSREVYFVGEINDADKQKLFERAIALLFPIKWPEPFGTVLIEAMACGTPALGFACGGVPEVLQDGVTGIVVESVEEAMDRLIETKLIDRAKVRKRFEDHFTARVMAERHIAAFRKQIDAASKQG